MTTEDTAINPGLLRSKEDVSITQKQRSDSDLTFRVKVEKFRNEH